MEWGLVRISTCNLPRESRRHEYTRPVDAYSSFSMFFLRLFVSLKRKTTRRKEEGLNFKQERKRTRSFLRKRIFEITSKEQTMTISSPFLSSLVSLFIVRRNNEWTCVWCDIITESKVLWKTRSPIQESGRSRRGHLNGKNIMARRNSWPWPTPSFHADLVKGSWFIDSRDR